MEDYRDPEVLRRLYWDLEMTQEEIANRLYCSPATITYQMAKHGIPCRPDKPRPVKVSVGGNRMTLMEIAEKAGLSYKIVKDRYGRGWRGDELSLPKGVYRKYAG